MATTPPIYEIPLVSLPQQLGIALQDVNLDNKPFILGLTWCWPVQCWMLDIYDGTTLEPLLLGRPMVTGADLLSQFHYIGIRVELIVQTDYDTLAMPTFYNLGTTSHLFFIPVP